ncbi:Glutaminyl-peptide cyclotransferase [Nymphon striatum]|nr:Glutaminyl-peptide cyclotransferase [Nymphon striatum]
MAQHCRSRARHAADDDGRTNVLERQQVVFLLPVSDSQASGQQTHQLVAQHSHANRRQLRLAIERLKQGVEALSKVARPKVVERRGPARCQQQCVDLEGPPLRAHRLGHRTNPICDAQTGRDVYRRRPLEGVTHIGHGTGCPAPLPRPNDHRPITTLGIGRNTLRWCPWGDWPEHNCPTVTADLPEDMERGISVMRERISPTPRSKQERTSMQRALAWFLAAFLLVALLVLAVFVGVPRVEDDIEAQTNAVLAANDWDDVRAEVDGRNVRLVGLPDDATVARQIANLVNDNVDGVRQVTIPQRTVEVEINNSDDLPNVVVTVGERVEVSGTLATSAQVQRLSTRVTDLFGSTTSIDLRSNPSLDEDAVDRHLILIDPVLQAVANQGLVEGTVELRRPPGSSALQYQLNITGVSLNELTREAVLLARDGSGIQGNSLLEIAETISPKFTGEELEPQLLRIKLLTLRYGSSEIALSDSQVAELQELVDVMDAFPSIEITVVGHRASVEGPARGERRTVIVFDQLLELGADPARLSTRDASDLEAIAGTDDIQNARSNRRDREAHQAEVRKLTSERDEALRTARTAEADRVMLANQVQADSDAAPVSADAFDQVSADLESRTTELTVARRKLADLQQRFTDLDSIDGELGDANGLARRIPDLERQLADLQVQSNRLRAIQASCGGSDAPSLAEAEAEQPTDVASPQSTSTPSPTAPAPEDLEFQQLTVEVLDSFPHDTGSFTQGLELDPQGRLFESAGSPGDVISSLREVEAGTGSVLRSIDIEEPLFAEGLTLVDDRLFLLTWQAQRAFVFDVDTFELLEEFSYVGDGWGLCYDGERLVMSNGSDQLTFRDPETFESLGTVSVTFNGGVLADINELECVDGQVWANIFLSDQIVRIDPATGKVNRLVTTVGLIDPHPVELQSGSVLNGIAYNADTDTFLITGKRWPTVFEVQFVPAT